MRLIVRGLMVYGAARFMAWKTFGTADPGLSLVGLATRPFPFPPVFDANNKVMLLNGSTFDAKRFDPETVDKAERYLRRMTNNFLSGCR